MSRFFLVTLSVCAPMVLMEPIAQEDADDDPLIALMMGGTTSPTPSEFWQDTIITDYIDPATGSNYTPVLLPTPESFSSTSVPVGLADLQAAMAQQPTASPGQPCLVEGYSQSAQIAINEKIELMQAGQQPDVTFLVLGDPNHPNGGLDERSVGMFTPGLGGGYAPLNGAEPTDAGIPPSTSQISTTPSPIIRNFRSTRSPA